MSFHQITTSIDDKLIKLNTIFKEDELDNLDIHGYAYYFRYKDYSLIIPCTLIFESYYAYRKPLLKATLTGNLKSMYFDFKYDGKSRIDIYLHKHHQKKLLPYICQLLIDKNVLQKFTYIFFQKIKNKNVLDYKTLRCFIPYYGKFNLDIDSRTIFHPLHKEVCIAYQINHSLFLEEYGVNTLNVHYKDSTHPTNIFKKHNEHISTHKFINFLNFISYLKHQKLLPSHPFIENQLIHTTCKGENYVDIHLYAYKYRKGYIIFIFIHASTIEKNLLYLYIRGKKKTAKKVELNIIKKFNNIKQDPLKELNNVLKKTFSIQNINISKYYITQHHANYLTNSIRTFCDNLY